MGKVLIKSGYLLIGVALLLAACNGQRDRTTSDEYRRSIDDWHSKRIEGLKSANGWLNLAGLYWLKEGMNSFGSASTNDLVFPPKVAGLAGYFMLKQGIVTMEAVDGSTIFVKGQPVKSIVAYHPDSTTSSPKMEAGTLVWFVIKRDDQYGIRLRDLESETVRNFHGIDRYPVDENWKVKARFERAEPGKTIAITNILGQTTPNTCPGTLVFDIGGSEYRLDAIDEGGPDLFVIFGDPTNEKETYPSGRYVYVAPADETGITYIDFNKSYNPPCAFTPFATCPLPPRQNILSVAVLAGEKNYAHKPAI